MAFRRPARLGALAVIVASIAFPAAASGADASGGAAAPVETGPGYNVNAPSGGAAAGAVPPPAPAPKPGSSGDHKTSHKKKKKKAPTWRFPVAGTHNYGGPGARFGAPRSGHTHQGQDVLAGEGTPLVAPHRGYIKYIGDQPGGAGIYIVMHASGTSYDFALMRSEEHTSELQSRENLVCRLLLEKKKKNNKYNRNTIISANLRDTHTL